MNDCRLAWMSVLILLLEVTPAAGMTASGAFAAQPAGSHLEVKATSSRVNLSVHGVPLGDVLAAIGRQAGVKVVLSGDFDTPVSETFVDEAVDEAILKLTQSHSVLLIYREPEDGEEDGVGLTEVRVISTRGGAGAIAGGPPMTRADGSRLEEPRPSTTAHRRKREQLARELTITLRDLATTDASPGIRGRALQRLARQPGVDAVKELREAAIRDPEPRVRQAAIRALGRIRSTEAADAVRLMLDDFDPNVRELASQVLDRLRQNSLTGRDD